MSIVSSALRVGAVAWLMAASAPGQTDSDLFVDCLADLRSDPGSESASQCFRKVSDSGGHRDEAMRHLQEFLGRQPDRPWALYYLGGLSKGEAAFGHLREARGLFEAAGDVAAAFRTQLALVRKLDRQGLLGQAENELERARGMLPEGDREAVERLRVLEALLKTSRGDLDDALALVLDVKEQVIPGAPDDFREELFFLLHAIYYQLGRYRQAGEELERCIDIARARGSLYSEALLRYQLAVVAVFQPGQDRESLIEAFRRALDLAESVERTDMAARAHLELARLGQDVRRHVDRCLEISQPLEPLIRSGCLGALAFALREVDTVEAGRTMDRAIAIAREAESPWPSVYLWADRMPVSWATRPREDAIRDSIAALEEIEKMRDAELDDAIRAEYFSVWADAYQWLAGKLLLTSGSPIRRRDLEEAFDVMERYRARVLLERLQEAGAWPDLPEDDRDEVRSLPSGVLDQVESAVHDDEAMLVFQMGDWEDYTGRFGGGSWLYAISRNGTQAYRLDEIETLEGRVRGLAESGSGLDPSLAESLHEVLLQRAVAELPAETEKLIIAPDGVLHHLPFDSLRPAGGEPLAVRYEISLIPSAKIWLRWRLPAGEPEPGPALVLADPTRPAPRAEEGAGVDRREAVERECRRLPFAREEGEAILKKAGRSSVLRLGDQASESYLKQEDLRRFGVIHLASHSFVDGRNAERSLVCLAAGSQQEDGNLQVREIVNLDLGGQLVVLASCDSAAGPRLEGEGVMSLARAFFLAGASAVVGSLQSIDDAEAKDLFIRFHGHLAAGRSVAGALRAAKREIFEAQGAVAAYANSAWNHVVVLGDGSLVPLSAEPAPSPYSSWLIWVAVILVIYLISIGVRIWLQRR